MDKIISAAEAKRKFAKILQEVREGKTYVVTYRREHIARIASVRPTSVRFAASNARRALLSRLRRQPVVRIPRWEREDL